MFGIFSPILSGSHYYTFSCTGLKRVKNKTFASREEAKQYMYEICGKNGLQVKDIWEDHHEVTYLCTDGVRFFIHRA